MIYVSHASQDAWLHGIVAEVRFSLLDRKGEDLQVEERWLKPQLWQCDLRRG
jgi:hypothetical protein